MARGIEIDWVVVRVNTLRHGIALGTTALVAAAVLAVAYVRLHQPPQVAARRAIERAEAAERTLRERPVPEPWTGEVTQASAQLEQARQSYAREQWRPAVDLAQGARQRFEVLLGAGDREVVGEGQIFSLEGSVSVQRTGKADWTAAHEKMPIFNGDFVRTGPDGSAEIMFADGSLYRVAPNTLLEVHSPQQQRPDEGAVRMVVGRINVYTSTTSSTVTTDSAQTRVERDSRVAVNVREEGGTEVAAFSGGARVRNPVGEEVVLGSREQVQASPSGGFGSKSRLPSPPVLLEPRNNALFELDASEPIILSWRPLPAQDEVRLQVGRSKRFLDGSLDVDGRIAGASARLQPVAPGTYYWRAATVGPGGVQSEWCTPRRFQILSSERRVALEDRDPPELDVEPATQMGHLFIVEGQTEVGASVTINGEPVEVTAEGSFRKAVEVVDEGWNELVVAAVDPSGNRSERRQRVYVEVF